MYFGAHWAPPSRLFTERLIGFNQIIKNSFQERFQVVFISDDGDQDAFGRNFNLMPWAALQFDKTEIKMNLKKIAGINGIPHLLILAAYNGEVIEEDASDLINDEPQELYKKWLHRLEQLHVSEEMKD